MPFQITQDLISLTEEPNGFHWDSTGVLPNVLIYTVPTKGTVVSDWRSFDFTYGELNIHLLP